MTLVKRSSTFAAKIVRPGLKRIGTSTMTVVHAPMKSYRNMHARRSETKDVEDVRNEQEHTEQEVAAVDEEVETKKGHCKKMKAMCKRIVGIRVAA